MVASYRSGLSAVRGRLAGAGKVGRRVKGADPARAGASVACVALAGAWVAALRPSYAGPLLAACVVAVLSALAGVLARQMWGVFVATAILGGAYLLSQLDRPLSVVVPAAIGTLLLSAAELAWWSAELSTGTSWSPGSAARRWSELGLLVGGGFALAVTVGVAGVTGFGTGTPLLVAGAACALGLGLLLARSARQVTR